MSQGDYIKRKQISHKLEDNGLSSYGTVLNAKDYTDFKKYSLEGTITSSTATLNNLEIPNKPRIFDMEMDTTNCPSFIVCNGTDTRPNRVLNSHEPTCNPVMKAPGRSVPPAWDKTNKKITSQFVYPAFKDVACNCKRSKGIMVDGVMSEIFTNCSVCN
jgi:hypothetical protein